MPAKTLHHHLPLLEDLSQQARRPQSLIHCYVAKELTCFARRGSVQQDFFDRHQCYQCVAECST